MEGGEELYQPADSPILRREESDENEAIVLDDIPAIAQDETEPEVISSRRSKRKRSDGQPQAATGGDEIGDSDQDDDDDYNDADIADIHTGLTDDEVQPSDDDLFVDQRPSKRRKEKETEPTPGEDDKKKMAMDISYEGFAIYGRVLCLVVKRRGGVQLAASNKSQTASQLGGQAMMENWITSTQMPPAEGTDEVEA